MTAAITITAVMRCQSFTACNEAIFKESDVLTNQNTKTIAKLSPAAWDNSQTLPEQYIVTVNVCVVRCQSFTACNVAIHENLIHEKSNTIALLNS